MSRTIWIVQKPRNLRGVDMDAAERIGEVKFLLPAAPNMHDEDRVAADREHMVKAIRESGPDDVFAFIGGSPFSHQLFGEALILSGKRGVNMGLYSRGRDQDGRRGGDAGSYRSLPHPLPAEIV